MALLLLVITVVSVGCGNTSGGSDSTGTQASAEATDSAVSGDATQGDITTSVVFPDEKFNENFTVYQRSETEASYPGMYIYAEAASDTMSSAVYSRNVAVEEKYGVTIVSNQVASPHKNVENLIVSEAVDFDVILDQRNELASLSRKGYLYNFNNLDIDFTTPWWDANCASDYNINGKLFFMANDTSVSNLAGARFFFFNKNMIKEYSLESPYDLYNSNDWDLEHFLNLVSSVHVSNGDEVADGQDYYGLLQETGATNGNIMHLLVGCGTKFSEFNGAGELITEVNNEKTQDILTKVAAVLKSNAGSTDPCVLDYDKAKANADISAYANKYDFGRSLFAAGHFLFVQGNMHVSSQFAEMTGEGYGVITNPKYNKDQEKYVHKMDSHSIIWAIPNHTGLNTKKVALVMDYWAYESSQSVMPSYYEITIKTRRVKDTVSSDMLDVVKSTIRYDLSDIYGIAIADTVYSAYTSGSLSSTWKGQKKTIEISLQKLVDEIDKLK